MTYANRLNAYRLLGVTPDSDEKTIRSAWRALVRTYHPDLARQDPVAANRRLTEINAAFDLIASAPDVVSKSPQTPPKPAPRKSAVPPRRPSPAARPRKPTVRPAPAIEPLVFTEKRIWSAAELSASRAAQTGFAANQIAIARSAVPASQKLYS